MDEIDRLLAPTYLAGLETKSLDALRSMKAECKAVENGLSYARRLSQGHLDIVRRMADRSAAGEGGGLADLVAQLPEILAGGARTEGGHRSTEDLDLEPPAGHEALVADLDELLPPARLATLPDASPAEFSALVDDLEHFERRTSDRRRALHRTLDAIQGELARRYQQGDASVDALLP